jgi:hypothetical protein
MSILKFCKVPSEEIIENYNSAKYYGNEKMTNKQKNELKNICTEIINTHWERYLKEKNKKNLLENKNNSWINNGSSLLSDVCSSLARSRDSSMGSLYEKIVNAISNYFNTKTFKNIKGLKIKDSGKNWIIDLAFERDGITYLVEIKLGGNLDNKKAISEANALSVRKQTLIENNLAKNVETYLGIITLGNGETSPDEWEMGRVSLGFDRTQVLVERELFDFVSNNAGVFDFLVAEIQPIVMNGWNDVEKKIVTKYISKEWFINFINHTYN